MLMPSSFFHYKMGAGGFEVQANGRPYPHFVLDVADTTQVSLITGRIATGSGGCTADTSLPANPFSASVVLEPGGRLVPAGPDGSFTIAVSDTGSFSLSQVLPGSSNIGTVSQACPAAGAGFPVHITGLGQRIMGLSFVNKPDSLCRALSVDVVQGRTRRCRPSLSVITVSNDGLLPATGVNLMVEASSTLIPMSASMTPVQVNDSLRMWTLGTLAPGQKVEIRVTDSVACRAGLTGRTVCLKARLQPGDTCLPTAVGWDGAKLHIAPACSTGYSSFMVTNNGLNMSDSTTWRLIVDSVMVQSGKLKLASGASVNVQVVSQGMLTRLEVDRTPGDPYEGYSSAILEFCGLTTPPTARTGMQNFSPDEASASYEEQCSEVVDSYDPNDKQAIPAGVGHEHTALFKDWMEYQIRFENMGSDTAFMIEIRDSLDPALDLATVRFCATSHKFETRLEGTADAPVLVWKARNANLLWTSRYPRQSQGFVKFKAKTKPGLPEGTALHNEASIIFDYNAPVVTNRVSHTMRTSLPEGTAPGGVTVVVGPVSTRALALAGSLLVSPNPARDMARLNARGAGGWLEAYSPDGRLLRRMRIDAASAGTIERGGIASSWMLIRWKPDTGGSFSQKLLWE